MRILNKIGIYNLRGDVFGGITAAVVALPMALAFGVASGAGAEAGLYGAVLVGLSGSIGGLANLFPVLMVANLVAIVILLAVSFPRRAVVHP